MAIKKIDPREIGSFHDLRLAKEQYRYDILVREQALLSSSGALMKTVRATLNTSMLYLGQIAVAAAARRLFRPRSRRK
jgi:hypothetical protein